MTTDYARIRDFAIDEGEPELTFEARLARENGWTKAFARRVVVEYKRFVHLAMTAGHTVTPSEEVDQAWHMHLTYTRSYWERMCGELLKRPLHHGPTRGGAAESAKFHDLYERTLAAYRTAFAVEPPADIWPCVKDRFGDDLHHVRVNSARNWVVPKRPVRRAFAMIAAVLVLLPVVGCAGSPFDPLRKGTENFLAFFILSMFACLIAGRILAWRSRTPGAQPGDEEPDMDGEAAAYLKGGREALTTAAICRLGASKALYVSEDGKSLLWNEDHPPHDPTSVEAAVLAALPLANDRRTLDRLHERVGAAFTVGYRRLCDEGYLLTPRRRFMAGLRAASPLLLLPAILLGVSVALVPVRMQMVLFLVCFVFACATMCTSLRRLTRRGSYVLDRLRRSHDENQKRESSSSAVGLAVGLHGITALFGIEELESLRNWFPSPVAGDGGCGTGCGGGGGGCGGGGCGGGCGGCGGCGG